MFPQFSCFKSTFFCEPCQLAKHYKSIYPPSNNNKSSIQFSPVHSDVWGPSLTNSLFDFRYFVTFVDNYSRVTWVYLLKNKSDVCATFKSFHNIVTTQFNTKLWVLRLDNGEEYLSREFSSFLDTSSIIHQTTCPSTPEQNGVVERKNDIYWRLPAQSCLLRMCQGHFGLGPFKQLLINRMSSHALAHKSPVEIYYFPTHPHSLYLPKPLDVFVISIYPNLTKPN